MVSPRVPIFVHRFHLRFCGCWDFNLLPTNGFSIKPLKVKLLAGEQKATEQCYESAPVY